MIKNAAALTRTFWHTPFRAVGSGIDGCYRAQRACRQAGTSRSSRFPTPSGAPPRRHGDTVPSTPDAPPRHPSLPLSKHQPVQQRHALEMEALLRSCRSPTTFPSFWRWPRPRPDGDGAVAAVAGGLAARDPGAAHLRPLAPTRPTERNGGDSEAHPPFQRLRPGFPSSMARCAGHGDGPSSSDARWRWSSSSSVDKETQLLLLGDHLPELLLYRTTKCYTGGEAAVFVLRFDMP